VSFRVQLAGGDSLGSVARDLRRAGKGLRPTVAAKLRKPTERVYRVVYDSILTADLPGQRVRRAKRPFRGRVASQGLRRPTARALTWKVSTSAGNPTAHIEFRRTKMPIRIQPLYPYWVGQKTKLRHPVMGNRKVWAGQTVPNVWQQTRRLAPAAQAAVRDAINETADIIAGRR
jgi:hypothetical protein